MKCNNVALALEILLLMSDVCFSPQSMIVELMDWSFTRKEDRYVHRL